MARVNIEECWWSDLRRSALIRLVGSEDAADIAAVRMWRAAQEFWKHDRKLMPLGMFELLPAHKELLQVGLAVVRESFVYVRGSSEYLDWVREKRAQASEAGKKSAEARRKKNGSAQPKVKKPRTNAERTPNEPRTESNDAEPSFSGSSSFSGSGSGSGSELYPPGVEKSEPPTRAVWIAYEEAWKGRHPGEPLRDRTVNSQLATFVRRVGREDAPAIAAFYVTHNDPFYVKNRHPVNLLLRDVERIRGDWQAGRGITHGEAKNAESLDYYKNQMARVERGEI